MKRSTFERALHNWPEWQESIEKSRKILGYNPGWPKDKCLAWIEDNVQVIRSQSENELNRLNLPPRLQGYWADCFYSDFLDNSGSINLRKITSHLSDQKSEPHLPCDQYISWHEGEDLDDPWIRIEIRIHEQFADSKAILNYAVKNALRTLQDELSLRSVEPHPLQKWLSGGRPPVDKECAIECARLKDEEVWTEVEIGKYFGWTLQDNEYGVPNQCRTARRYVKIGRDLIKKTGHKL